MGVKIKLSEAAVMVILCQTTAMTTTQTDKNMHYTFLPPPPSTPHTPPPNLKSGIHFDKRKTDSGKITTWWENIIDMYWYVYAFNVFDICTL